MTNPLSSDKKQSFINHIKQLHLKGFMLNKIPPLYNTDKDVNLTILSFNHHAFPNIHHSLQNDEEFLLQILQKAPHTLYYFDETFKNNKKIILQAVQTDGEVLQFASEHLKNDLDIAFEAIQSNPWSIQYMGPNVKVDKSIVEIFVKFFKELYGPNINACTNYHLHKHIKHAFDTFNHYQEHSILDNFFKSSNNNNQRIKF